MTETPHANPIPPATADAITRDGPAPTTPTPAPIARPGMRAKAYVDCSPFDCEIVECAGIGATVRFTDEKPDEHDDEAFILWDDLVIYVGQQLQDDAPRAAERGAVAHDSRSPLRTVQPRGLSFQVGPFTYEAFVVADHPISSRGERCDSLVDYDQAKILLHADVCGKRRLNVLLCALARVWRYHFPTELSDQGEVDMSAKFCQCAMQDLLSQGGLEALDSLFANGPAPAPAASSADANLAA